MKWLDGQYPYEYKTYHSYSEGDPSEEPMPYGKYWNGYLVFLRPLLCFFTYDGIYFGTYRLLAVMLILSVILMLFRNRVFVVPFSLAFLTLRPFSKFCLTYAVMEILLLVFLDIAVLDKRIHTPGKTRSVFFVLMGVVSVYFTLLQFSFIIPLFTALYLVFSDQQMLLRRVSALNRMLCDIFEYAVGFCAMWAGKWVILAVFAPDGVSYLLQSIKLRSSSNDGGEIITLKDVLLWNGCGFYYKNRALIWSAAVLAVAVLITVVLLIMVRRKDSSAKFVTVGEALTAVAALFSVLIRYILLMNHSRVHYFFMNRLMSAVVLAILALVFMIMTRIAYALSGKQRKTE